MKKSQVILAGLLFGAQFVFGQSYWLSRGAESSFSFEYLRPTFVAQPFASSSISGSVYIVSGRLALGERTGLLLELPYSIGEVSSTFGPSVSHSSLGNLYVGGEFFSENKQFFTNVGIRLPFAQEEKFFAQYVGFNSDYDRWEAFIPNVASVSAIFNYKPQLETGFYLRLLAGPSLWIKTKPGTIRDDTEFFLNYGSIVGYESDVVNVGLGITGKMLLTETGDLEQRNHYQLGLVAGTMLGNVRPEIHLRLPLDKSLRNTIDRIVALQVTLEL
ncbi:MAG TPA: hypothetical protein VI704_04230 [Bacteroidota bacterium]|nr:hypothetical protein [Bacteroidota bacterium]